MRAHVALQGCAHDELHAALARLVQVPALTVQVARALAQAAQALAEVGALLALGEGAAHANAGEQLGHVVLGALLPGLLVGRQLEPELRVAAARRRERGLQARLSRLPCGEPELGGADVRHAAGGNPAGQLTRVGDQVLHGGGVVGHCLCVCVLGEKPKFRVFWEAPTKLKILVFFATRTHAMHALHLLTSACFVAVLLFAARFLSSFAVPIVTHSPFPPLFSGEPAEGSLPRTQPNPTPPADGEGEEGSGGRCLTTQPPAPPPFPPATLSYEPPPPPSGGGPGRHRLHLLGSVKRGARASGRPLAVHPETRGAPG